ncbi:MAG TPA: tetratricopeptide repeat protein, partial [Burkholderiales bacterium]|nr:tetratricopeptide repeat protein [Burkholderiales bacterium]
MRPKLLTLALAATLALPACAAGQSAAKPPDPTPPAAQGLSEPMLYEFLLGEIALQRGDARLAAQTYLDLARRTGDARVARRAVEVANQAQLPDLALEAARTWEKLEPESPQALQVVAVLLIAAKRVDEAEPYLHRLLSSEGVNLESGFMQLNRLLAGNPDKASNLRVVRKLAARHPALPQAHFAIAQAAYVADDDEAALAAIRDAAALRPDWEVAALFEAQVLQRRSPAAAAERLAAFLERNPQSREVRMNYARALVLDKRYDEARQQYQAMLAASPGNTEVIYAVGLLAFQLKDYPVAEENMKRLLGMGYRDGNGVRYLLGQMAEEQKHWPDAIKWYDGIKSGDHVVPARLRTAGAMAKQGQLDEARAYLRRVGADHPD